MTRAISACGVALALVLSMAAAMWALVPSHGEGRLRSARAGVQTLTLAAEAYEARFGQRPPQLQSLLATPAGAFIGPTAECLLDPWGRPYRYDPAGPRNNGLKPDVWSDGPDPADRVGVIGNWPAEGTPAPENGPTPP
jgi:hypothetical protein